MVLQEQLIGINVILKTQDQNGCLDILNGPSFQTVNSLFDSSFKDDDARKSYKQYYLPIVEIKDYHVQIDKRTFFDRSINNDLKTFDNIRKIATGQSDDYKTGFLLGYICFKNYYKLIVIELSRQQKLDLQLI